ncbi:MAG: DUF6266 family protein [Paludibacter sp.]
MAEFNSSTFGTISGRHGSAVATTTKSGKSILRIFRAPSDPKTEKQVAQRTKFGFSIAILSCLRALFNITFRGKGGANYGIGLAMREAIVGTSPDYSLDYSKLKLSEGSVRKAGTMTVTKVTDTDVKVEWNVSNVTNNNLGAKENDGVNLIFLCEKHNEALLYDSCCNRIDATFTVTLPDYWAPEKVHCWMYFSRVDGKLNSDSQYFGELQL